VVKFTRSLSLLVRLVDFDLGSNWLRYLRLSHLTEFVFMSGVQVRIELLAATTVLSLALDDRLLLVQLVDGLQT